MLQSDKVLPAGGAFYFLVPAAAELPSLELLEKANVRSGI